jgi:type VI secretion system protein ImpH
MLQHYFRVPLRIEQFVGHWMALSERERTYLQRTGATLGTGAVLGRAVWDCQHKFRIHMGPLTLEQYESFLPGHALLSKLVDWVRLFLCFELDWDVRLRLKADEVPRLTLGGRGRLGWTTWLGVRSDPGDADDLCLDAESFIEGNRVAA